MHDPHMFTDFTGDAYRLILQHRFNTLDAYEQSLSGNLNQNEWQQWHAKFTAHIDHEACQPIMPHRKQIG